MNTDFGQPNIAVDTIPFFFDRDAGEMKVVLTKRKFEPFVGEFALPGVLLLPGEMVDDAVLRAVKNKAGAVDDDVKLNMLSGVYDGPMRDPRSSTLSVAKIVILTDDFVSDSDVETMSVSLDQIGELPFDHASIIAEASEVLASRIFDDEKIQRAVFGDGFTTRDFTEVVESLGGSVDLSNVSRKIAGKPWIVKSTVAKGSASASKGRPSTQWVFKN